MTFNPFDKAIGDNLTAVDLQKLIENKVGEGYVVEYKSTFPNNDKIAKSVASFANTYGGWFMIGLKTDKHNVASEICGFDLTEFHDPISKIRETIKSYIDPTPLFFPQVVKVENDKAVLVIFIPENQETPFIHKDGRIYRRNHDSSDPISETNRYSFDRLIDKGRDIQKQFEKFCDDDMVLTTNEARQGCVKIYISPDPLGLIYKKDMVLTEGIDKLLQLSKKLLHIPMGESGSLSVKLPFDFCQPTYGSVILRQSDPRKKHASAAVELFQNGRARIYIPLNNLPNFFNHNVTSAICRDFFDKIYDDDDDDQISSLNFFDIGQLWLATIVLMRFYEEWLDGEALVNSLRIAMRVDNVMKSVPFFDSDDWGLHIQKYGLPIMNRNSFQIPNDLNKSIFINMRNDKSPTGVRIGGFIALGFGLPVELYAHTFNEAVVRADRKNKAE